MAANISNCWREIQGSDNWKGLVSPEFLVDKLREEILRYGDFTQACCRSFEKDTKSSRAGNSKYLEEELLERVGLPNTGYTITKFIYATSQLGLPGFFKHSRSGDENGNTWNKSSSWMGFVAVTTSKDEIRRLGRRDIVIVWRGTATKLERIENIKDWLRPTGLDPSDPCTDGCKVAAGFLSVYKSSNKSSSFNKESARDQVLAEVDRLVNKFQDEQLSITVTGYSLGGALALLSAYDIAERGYNRNGERSEADRLRDTIPVTVYSFSAPRLGNRIFGERCKALRVKVLRVFNSRDLVPKVPGLLLNEDSSLIDGLAFFPWAYTHVGTELELDSRMSRLLERDTGIHRPQDLLRVVPTLLEYHKLQHKLCVLLHLVDGYHGKCRTFSPSGKRDIAFVVERRISCRRKLLELVGDYCLYGLQTD